MRLTRTSRRASSVVATPAEAASMARRTPPNRSTSQVASKPVLNNDSSRSLRANPGSESALATDLV